MKAKFILLSAALLFICTATHARDASHVAEALAALVSGHPAAATGQAARVEVGFSPEGTAEDLIVKVIGSAKSDIKVLAYSFTSPVIVKALVAAKRRGVNVAVAADSSNVTSRPGSSALSTLVTAGVSVRTVSDYKILHDKVLVVDGRHVQTGSFNYSKSANEANSENAIVLWNAPEIAAAYAQHWKSRWDQGERFVPAY